MPGSVGAANVATIPDTQELVERARKLVPLLKTRAIAADKARRVPDETMRELLDAQLFQILVPHRFGGFENRFSTVMDIGLELARGCGSTAWLYCLLCNHHWILAHYPLEAQEEVYGGKSHAFFPQTVVGKGTARKVDGGYRISGQWAFATGVDFSEWVSATCSRDVENPHPLEDRLNFLARTSEVEVVDTWFTSGMRATGSRDFVLKDVFVPDRRIVTQADMLSGRTPGRRAQPEYVNLGAPYFSVLLSAVLGPLLGLTLRAIEEFVAYTKSRGVGTGGINHAARSATQIKLGYAQARYDAMRRAARWIFEEIEAALAAGRKIPAEQKIRNRRDAAYVGDECTKIVDYLVESAGSRGQHENSPFQMIQRDVHTIRTHIVFDLEDASEAYGRQMLGLPIDVLRF